MVSEACPGSARRGGDDRERPASGLLSGKEGERCVTQVIAAVGIMFITPLGELGSRLLAMPLAMAVGTSRLTTKEELVRELEEYLRNLQAEAK